MPEEEHGNVVRTLLKSGGNSTTSTGIHRAHGWTEEYCRYLDYLTTIDIYYMAPWHQRHRYESSITLACNDRQAGKMKARKIQTHFENSRKSLTRSRTTEFLHSEERENEAITIR